MSESQVLIDGATLDVGADEANTFKGFGYISCNNSSRLLLDYKAEHPNVYRQILITLFGGEYPVLRMLKVEMGDDANTSSGTEPATMRSAEEKANVSRGAGFQIIADAKKIQPALKTAILRWGEPGWLKDQWKNVKSDDPDHLVPASAFEPMYQWYKQTIIAAYQRYGYLIDYIDPDRNENTKPMLTWIKWFSQRIKNDQSGFPTDFPVGEYQHIKIIAADQNYETNFGDYMVEQENLRELVDAVGYHYNTDDGPQKPFTELADHRGREVWYSEGVAPMEQAKYRVRASAKTSIGGPGSSLDVANRVIKGYFKSRRSLYLFQPAVSAFYPGVNYTHKELIAAQRPWSGYFEADNVGLQVIKHFTDFAVTGWRDNDAWRYLKSACYSGVGGTENLDHDTDKSSYLTLVAPDKKNFSFVAVNDSATPRKYQVAVKNLKLADAQIEIWTTCGPKAGETYDAEVKMVTAGQIDPAGNFTCEVPAYGIVTVTTLIRSQDPTAAYQKLVSPDDEVLGSNRNDEFLYHDDFEYSADCVEQRGGTPRYTTDQGGAFEVVKNDEEGYVLQQMITEKERALDWEYSFAPNLTVGDDQWSDYEVETVFKFDQKTVQNSADGNYFAIGLRSITDIKGRLQSAPYVLKLDNNGHYELIIKDRVVDYDYVNLLDLERWHSLKFKVVGPELTGYLDGKELLTYVDNDNPTYSGRVKLGTGYYHTQVKSLSVRKVSGGSYVQQRIDDSEQAITYEGEREHVEGIRNSVWNRSLTTCGKDGQFSFKFEGTGFNLVGKQEQESKLVVFIDGSRQRDSVIEPQTGGDRQTNVHISELCAGQHKVTIKVAAGKYILDAVEILANLDK